jgi:hypothetical protein
LKSKELEDNLAFMLGGGVRDGDISDFRLLTQKILVTAEWLCSGELKILGTRPLF